MRAALRFCAVRKEAMRAPIAIDRGREVSKRQRKKIRVWLNDAPERIKRANFLYCKKKPRIVRAHIGKANALRYNLVTCRQRIDIVVE